MLSIQFIHYKNIDHWDLKPENILVDKIEDILILKIGDFGISKIND